MGIEVEISDRGRLANIALKWNLSHEEVTTVVVGTTNPNHLLDNLKALNCIQMTEEENEIIEKVRASSLYSAYEAKKTREFFEHQG
jgi:predicted aldo/keto reductase-like oxidoreductase